MGVGGWAGWGWWGRVAGLWAISIRAYFHQGYKNMQSDGTAKAHSTNSTA